jgi:hypothetical protein
MGCAAERRIGLSRHRRLHSAAHSIDLHNTSDDVLEAFSFLPVI